jgi:hypothetical protein
VSRRSFLLPNRKALALILVKVECRDGRSLGSVPVPRLHGPEVMGTLTQDRYAPGAQLGGCGFLLRFH